MTLALRPSAALLLLAFATSGCLPSCQKREDKALLPADSTSRTLAARLRPDTLRPAWTHADGLAFPRTVRFSTTGDTVWIADGQANRLVAFDRAGAVLQTVAADFRLPFLAGFRGDTVVVFSAGRPSFDLVVDGAVARRVPVTLPDDRSLVRYGHAFAGGFAVKAGGRSTDPFLLVVDVSGREVTRRPLPGPLWRHAGLLRTPRSSGASDTLYSLVGFVPVVDRFVGTGLVRDSLALVGFDSPKLDQRRRHLAGEADAPLLTSSAAPMPGGRLYVNNLRPGWLRVDVYEGAAPPTATLSAVLHAGEEALDLHYLVEDLDVFDDGRRRRVATVQANPRPQVTVWEVEE